MRRNDLRRLDGGLYCSSCGLYQHALAPESDDDDYARRGRTVRLKTKKDRDGGKGKVRRVYRGEKAWRLYLIAWGWVLWRGCWGLVNLKLKEMGTGKGEEVGVGVGGEVGQEVWGVVRGLWALRLGMLKGRFKDEDVAHRDRGEGKSERGEGMESETTDTEDETQAEGEEQKTKTKTARKASDSPTLIDVAAMTYLGLLILRYPLTLETFFR